MIKRCHLSFFLRRLANSGAPEVPNCLGVTSEKSIWPFSEVYARMLSKTGETNFNLLWVSLLYTECGIFISTEVPIASDEMH